MIGRDIGKGSAVYAVYETKHLFFAALKISKKNS